MPLDSSRENVIKEKRKSHGFKPYDRTGRRAKMANLGSWRPSIWNALTFWKSSGSPSDQEEGNCEQDASDGSFSGPSSPTNSSALNGTNDSPNSSADSESNGERHANDSFTSDLSEAQVSSHLTSQPPRHVHFELPCSDQERLNSRHLQTEQVNKQSITEPSSRQNHSDDYVAPIPPSSPLHRLATSQQDPLTQVAEYIANRDGRRPLNHVEALGLNTLIQQSVYAPGLPIAARYHEQQGSDFIPATSGLISISPSPPIRPTFTNPSTDIAALLTSSSTPSTSDLHPTPSVNKVTPTRSSASPSRTLARNPNGTLYYEGGGSARAQYRSSTFSASPTRKKVAFPRGFGDSPRPNGPTRPADTPSPSDGKRRRVGEERHSSTAQASGLVPAMVNGSANANKTPITQPVTASASIRLSTPSPGSRLLANTPARPSPLRQSVRADSSSPNRASPGSANEVSPRTRVNVAESPSRVKASEKASEIMAGIISDATPKKDQDHISDLRNPYQGDNRSPARRNRKPAMKAPRPPPRPTRSTGPPPPPQPKKLSALETIQRTAPQTQTGSKRSRASTPPLEPKAPIVNGVDAPPDGITGKPESSADTPVVIEIDEDSDDDQTKYPPSKKQRQEGPEETAEKERKFSEVDDITMDGPDSSSAAEKAVRPSEVLEHDAERQNSSENKRLVFAVSFGKKAPMTRFQSVPKEPSPLRQSFQPDVLSSPPKDVSSATSSVPKESLFAPTSTSTSTFAPASMSTSTFAPTSTSAFVPTSTSAFAPTSSSSSFTQGFTPSSFSPPVPSALTQDTTAAAWPVTTFPPTSSQGTDWLATAKKQVLNMPADALPAFGFPLTNSPAILSSYESQRGAALAVPAHELPKFDFTVAAVPKVEIRAFDFKAAGMKPLVKSGWTCATCLITNNNDATKCVSCESTR